MMVFREVEGSISQLGSVSGTDATPIGINADYNRAQRFYIENPVAVIHTATGIASFVGAGEVVVSQEGSAIIVSGTPHTGGVTDTLQTVYDNGTGVIQTTAGKPVTISGVSGEEDFRVVGSGTFTEALTVGDSTTHLNDHAITTASGIFENSLTVSGIPVPLTGGGGGAVDSVNAVTGAVLIDGAGGNTAITSGQTITVSGFRDEFISASGSLAGLTLQDAYDNGRFIQVVPNEPAQIACAQGGVALVTSGVLAAEGHIIVASTGTAEVETGYTKNVQGFQLDHMVLIHEPLANNYQFGLDSHGVGTPPAVRTYKSQGDHDTMLPVNDGDTLGLYEGFGYGDSNYGSSARIRFIAADDFTNGHSPGRISFSTTPPGSNNSSGLGNIRASADYTGWSFLNHQVRDIGEVVAVSGTFSDSLTVSGLPVLTAVSAGVDSVNSVTGAVIVAGVDGNTIITEGQTVTVSGFEGEFVAASGSLQTQIDGLSSGGVTSVTVTGTQLTGDLTMSSVGGATVHTSGQTVLVSGIAEVADDLDPELGGHLEAGNFNVTGMGRFLATSGTETNPAFSFTTDFNTGIINPSDNRLALVAGSKKIVEITSSIVILHDDVVFDFPRKTEAEIAGFFGGNLRDGSTAYNTTTNTLSVRDQSEGWRDVALTYNETVSGTWTFLDDVDIQGNLTVGGDNVVLETEFVAASGFLQTQIDNIPPPDISDALIGADGITIISGTNTTTVSGFRDEFVSSSGSLQTQIDNIDSSVTLQDAYDNGNGSIVTSTSIGPFTVVGSGLVTDDLDVTNTLTALAGSFLGIDVNGTVDAGTGDFTTSLTISGQPVSTGTGGVGDHGDLTGLSGDDHLQYHNDTRGDARYYTQTQINSTTSGSPGTSLIGFPTGSGFATPMPIDDPSPSLRGAMSFFQSAGWVSGGTIADIGGSNVSVSSGTGTVRTSDSSSAALLAFGWDAVPSISIATDSTRYIGVSYNSSTDNASVLNKSSNTWDYTTEFPLGLASNRDGDLTVIATPHTVGDAVGIINRRFEETEGAQRASGMILTESADTNREVLVSAGVLWYKLNRFTTASVDTGAADTFDAYYSDGGSGWNVDADETQWDNLSYDDGSGTLATLNPNRYGNLWFYLESNGNLSCVYGVSNTNDLLTAELEPAPSDLPPGLAQSVFLGRILFIRGGTIAIDVQSAFDTNLNLSSTTDHGSLGGLTDDDHTQYAREDGSRGFSATVSGVDPVDSDDLATKNYVDAQDVAISGHLQTAIDNVPAPDISDALIGVDGITIISGTNTTTVSGFRDEFVAASGSLQSNIDVIEDSKSLTVEQLINYEDISFFYTTAGRTVNSLIASIRGSDDYGTTWTVRYASVHASGTGTEIINGGTTTHSGNSGQVITSFDNPTITGPSFVWVETTTASGTIDEFSLTLI
jgi:hypothetical protein